MQGDTGTIQYVGIRVELLVAAATGTLDAMQASTLSQLVEKAAPTLAINDAWAMLGLVTVAVLIFVPLARKSLVEPQVPS